MTPRRNNQEMIPGIASTFKNPCNTFWPQIGHYEPKTGHAVSDKLIWLCYRDLLSENPIQVPAGTEMNKIMIIAILSPILMRPTANGLYCDCEHTQ